MNKGYFFLALTAAVIGISGTASKGQDLTELTVSTAERVLTTSGGKWVLDAVDLRPMEGECAGKITIQFKANHVLEEQKCYDGGNLVPETAHWAITSAGPGAVEITISGQSVRANEISNLYLKDEGRGDKHDYYMMLNQYDVRDPKGGINLLHEYHFVIGGSRVKEHIK